LDVHKIRGGSEYLRDGCITLAAGQRHPEERDRTVAEVFAGEQARLLSVSVPFDGFRETSVRVSTTSLISYDNNRYSVDASSAGRTVMLRAYADRIVVVDDGTVVAEHRRRFSRDQVIYDPWHYLSVLERKPGALRNGAPFRDWELPPPLAAIREALRVRPDGDRQFVGILGAIGTYGLGEVATACGEALRIKAASRDVVLSILSRSHDDPDVGDCLPPIHAPAITLLPLADCCRYDALLSGGAHAAG
jgi:hypothetical protein